MMSLSFTHEPVASSHNPVVLAHSESSWQPRHAADSSSQNGALDATSQSLGT